LAEEDQKKIPLVLQHFEEAGLAEKAFLFFFLMICNP